jgi:murein L,D-transpeptidase YcbB/YkuD
MIDRARRRLLLTAPAALVLAALPRPAQSLSAATGFRQGVAEAAARSELLAAFYRARDFQPVWAGSGEAEIGRRNALLAAMAEAPAHGLPATRHDPVALLRVLEAARTPFDQGRAEVAMSRALLRLMRDLTAGLLRPRDVDPQIKREVIAADPLGLLTAFPLSEPVAFLRSLAPASAEYARLMRARMGLEAAIAAGGWGEAAPAERIEPGASGAAVARLRDRLVALGYLEPTASARYDEPLTAAVRRFQAAHGLLANGVAGASTLAEANLGPEARLRAVLVAMERERWSAAPRGARHIWVNLPDFHAAIVDDDRPSFVTRAVIGATDEARQTPEFSDLMDHMVVNPTWFVPRSIILRDFLPQLQRDRHAVGHLRVTDAAGRLIDRGAIDFRRYTAASFPYAMHQPPGPTNALGEVKFMFPNPWDIYLHDTPARELFAHETRAYSSGCIRLADPRGFAHVLLSRQAADPAGLYERTRQSGAETRVNIEPPVPVHLDYRTAFTGVRGELQFRRDIYGRDARIWAALAAEGLGEPGMTS